MLVLVAVGPRYGVTRKLEARTDHRPVMRFPLFLGALALLLVPLVAGSGDECTSNGWPSAGIIQVTGGTALTTAYLDDRNVVLGNGIYTYIESNGIWTPKAPGVYLGDPQHADLQRGGWCSIVQCANEPCWDAESSVNGPDILIDPTAYV